MGMNPPPQLRLLLGGAVAAPSCALPAAGAPGLDRALLNINRIPACLRRGDRGPADSGDKELAGLKDSI